MTPMTRDEYAQWLKTRGPVGTWEMDACRRADAYVKAEVLRAFERWAKAHLHGSELREVAAFLRIELKAHWGSLEVDELLTKLGCFADIPQE